jgi:hypothetical protein
MWRVAKNILNKQSQTADKEWSSSLEIGRIANIPSLTMQSYKAFAKPSEMIGFDMSDFELPGSVIVVVR